MECCRNIEGDGRTYLYESKIQLTFESAGKPTSCLDYQVAFEQTRVTRQYFVRG